LDDDDLVPADYADQMICAAEEAQAAVASGPWLNCIGVDREEVVEAGQRRRRSRPRLEDHPSTFPDSDVLTPFICGNFIARRDAIAASVPAVLYPINGWREETDLFLRIWAAGHGIVKSDRSYSWCEHRYSGGQRNVSRLRYELAVVANEFRFRRSNREVLKELGESGSPFASAARLIAQRWPGFLRSSAGSVVRRVRGRSR
jgi:GT2 family glycosyltransferase